MDSTQTRTSSGNTVSSRRTTPLKPNAGLSGPPGGKIKLQQQHWLISRALCGERVRLVTVEQRVLVYYCRTVVRIK